MARFYYLVPVGVFAPGIFELNFPDFLPEVARTVLAMSAPAAVDLAALREDLIGVAEQIHGVKRTARLITERIGEVRVNATRARENLETYATAAFAKGEHSVEAIEADRDRLLDEVRADDCIPAGSHKLYLSLAFGRRLTLLKCKR